MAKNNSQDNKGKKALFTFSADPITLGHIDLIERAMTELGFSEVEAAIAENPGKKGKQLFSLEERISMARKSLSHLSNIKVTTYRGLTVDYCYEQCINDIIKGVRNKEDEAYEQALALNGETQIPGIKTHCIIAKPELVHVSSTAAWQMQEGGGFVHTYVPLNVKQALEARISSEYIAGITGELASGKSYIGKKLVEIGEKRGIPVYNIDLDRIGHDILGQLKDPIYVALRKEMVKKFGKGIEQTDGFINGKAIGNPHGFINRKALGEIVFNNQYKLDQLNKLLELPMQVRLRREFTGKKGLLLFNAALIAETSMSYLCNNNTVLVTVDKSTQEQRMADERKLTPEQIQRRLNSQFNGAEKKARLEEQIDAHRYGKIWEIDTSGKGAQDADAERLFDNIIKDMDVYGELRFMGLWNRLNADGKYDDAYCRLRDEYLKPHRHYHTLNHVVSMLNDYNDIRHQLQDPDAVEFAIWTHDTVYADRSRVNEEKSAELAKRLCKDALLSDDFTQKVYDLNIVTKHNMESTTQDQAYMVDLDLAIFGKGDASYEEYEKNIKKEYEYVDEYVFRKARASILQNFLDRPQIYRTEHFRNKYEAKARDNLIRAINNLLSDE
jgi:pantetheine-phosphate adenylyltransferase